MDPIQTERLTIEPLTTSDSGFIYKLVNTDEWISFIGDRSINSRRVAVGYIQTIIDNPNVRYWVARIRESGIPIGIVTLIKRSYLSHHDIGVAFLPEYTNRGYAYEATRAILHLAIYSAKHSHILSITIPDNHRSIKLLKKLGLQYDKEIKTDNEILQMYSASADKLLISETTRSFFDVFTTKNGKQPNWDLLKNICIAEAVMISKPDSAQIIYDLGSFIESRRKILSDGTISGFEEKETYEETRIVNGMAHRYSAYEKTGIADGKAYQQKGYKLFQFTKINGLWKIVSVVWEDGKLMTHEITFGRRNISGRIEKKIKHNNL